MCINSQIVDAENLNRHPWQEAARVETFLGLPSVVGKKSAFFYSKEKGFYCPKWEDKSTALLFDP